MATDTTFPDANRTPAAVAAPGTGAVATDPAVPAQSEESEPSSLSPPPRIDAGGDVDDVLVEVNKIFGGASGHAARFFGQAGDEIDQEIDKLAADLPQAAPLPVPDGYAERPPRTAADLFSSVEDRAEVGPIASEPVIDSAASTSSTSPDSTSLVKRNFNAIRGRSRFLLSRLPRRAAMPACFVAAALAGWIAAWLALTTRGGERKTESVAEESKPSRSVAEESHAADLDEKLQSALKERDVARRDREQVLARVMALEAKAHSGERSLADLRRVQAAQVQAEAVSRRADEELGLWQRRAYNAQLARARDSWRVNPGLAVALLEDVKRCPLQLRDFTWGYLYGRAKNDRGELRGHLGAVHSVRWSPDGKLLATCGHDGLVKLWDVASGKPVASLVAHAGGVAAIDFSRRGDLLASGGADGTVKLWNVATQKVIATFVGHIGSVRAVALSPDSSTLVSGADDGTLRFWEVSSVQLIATRWGYPRSTEPDNPDDPSRFVNAIAWSADGRWVASGGYQLVRVWRADDAVESASIPIAEGSVSALAFSPDGAVLMVGTDGALHRCDLSTLTGQSTAWPIDGCVNDLRFSADGTLLAAATNDGAVLFRGSPAALAGSRRLNALVKKMVLRGHVDAVTGVAYSPDSKTVATSGVDGTIRLWNARDGAVDKTTPDATLHDCPHVTSLAYSADGTTFAASSANRIVIWNIRDRVETATLQNHSGDVRAIAFSPNNMQLASAGDDWSVLIWDLPSQRVKMVLNGHSGGVNSVSYSADGKMLVTAADDGTVRIWDAIAGREIDLLSGHRGPVHCCRFSPDGKLAASAGADGLVKLWDVAKKREVASLSGNSAPVRSLTFSSDGRFLASVASPVRPEAAQAKPGELSPGTIRVWSVSRAEIRYSLESVASAMRGVAFSPDGKTLATSGDEGVSLWDAATGDIRETLRFSGAGDLSAIAFSPDGLVIAAGGAEAIAFWNAVFPAINAKSGSNKPSM